MHNVQNESLCMYIVILLCIVYKILTIYIYIYIFYICLIKNSWPRGILTRGHIWPCAHIPCVQVATYIYTRGHMARCNKYTRPIGHVYFLHVSNWPRVLITRGQLFSLYHQPRCHQDTWLVGHVSTVTATVDMRPIAAFF
jgi:hypothetical protein